MNVFEDLVLELKEESLLEDTVLEQHLGSDEIDPLEETAVPNRDFDPAKVIAASRPKRSVTPEPTEYDLQLSAPHNVEETAVVTRNDEQPASTQPSGREFFKKRAVAEVSSLQMVEHVLTGVEREYMKVKPASFDDL